ncbi:MAG: type I restriction endonuclease [Thermoguttaceae bacterium]|nr:type I restriction endonuclease [Thermoguttaceae bacterium]MDW8079276.1 type I restriction endonuclease [Thermoguttaceae bacterium]
METEAIRRLASVLSSLRQKLPLLREHAITEYSTRTILIDPVLEALGWNVREPEEVQLEYGVTAGKRVDYALKVNGKPTILVEAKSLSESLDDMRAVAQVISYAANEGIQWCVLTNGVVWQVYASMQKCPATEKLLFRLDLASDEAGDSAEELARQLWRISRDQVAAGILDELGNRKFNDNRVRKALLEAMRNPSAAFLRILRRRLDAPMSPQQVRESLMRLAESFPPLAHDLSTPQKSRPVARTPGQEKVSSIEEHLAGRSETVVALYKDLESFCLGLLPGEVIVKPRKPYVGFYVGGRCFCSVCFRRHFLAILVALKAKETSSLPPYARDVSQIGHHGLGDLRFRVTSTNQLEEVKPFIRQAFLKLKANSQS